MTTNRLKRGDFLVVTLPDDIPADIFSELNTLNERDPDYFYHCIEQHIRRKLQFQSTFPQFDCEDEETDTDNGSSAVEKYVKRFIDRAVRYSLIQNAAGIGDYVDYIIQDKFREIFSK